MTSKILFLVCFFTLSFTFAAEVKVGDAAPQVSGLDQEGKMVHLGEQYKQGYVLVYFYPKADTPGCTAEACSLRDAFQDLSKQGIAVFGVSADSPEDQKKFKEKYHLPFTLLSDSEKKISEGFGVPVTMGFTSRQSFIIKGGKIAWLDRKASTKEQANDVLKFMSTEKK